VALERGQIELAHCPHNHEEEVKSGTTGYHHGHNRSEDGESSNDKISLKMSHNIMQTPNT
jgi:hypothetical protein